MKKQNYEAASLILVMLHQIQPSLEIINNEIRLLCSWNK